MEDTKLLPPILNKLPTCMWNALDQVPSAAAQHRHAPMNPQLYSHVGWRWWDLYSKATGGHQVGKGQHGTQNWPRLAETGPNRPRFNMMLQPRSYDGQGMERARSMAEISASLASVEDNWKLPSPAGKLNSRQLKYGNHSQRSDSHQLGWL